VDPHLFYLVFGESVINDAVGLVLFEALASGGDRIRAADQRAVQKSYSSSLTFPAGFFGSLVLGTVFGLAVALFLKHIDFRHTPALIEYLRDHPVPFVVAELCHLSGIVTCLFYRYVAVVGTRAKRVTQVRFQR
jgi:NhaP-type Na+/H+ or K+/H+ antiporter